jgi:hypothetical protein
LENIYKKLIMELVNKCEDADRVRIAYGVIAQMLR